MSLEFAELERGMQLEGTVSEEEFITQMTSYPQMLEEFQGVDEAEVQDLNLFDEMSIKGSFVSTIPEEESELQFIHHAIVALDSRSAQTLGSEVHEILHALESSYEVKDGRIQGKTGFDEQENDEKILLSEAIHTKILFVRIYCLLRERGYQIDDYNDYVHYALPGITSFYTKFEQAILDARCEPTLDTLYSIVGRENFLRLAQLQNDWQNATPEQVQAIIADMEEYSRQNFANRIGEFTLPQQKNVEKKDFKASNLYGKVAEQQEVK